MTWLAFETSCDETSVAIGRNGEVLSNLVSSQADLHAEYGGVVPELATREHLRNLPVLTRAALLAANVQPADIELVAATRGPGLPSALLVGLKAAQAMAFGLRCPFLGVHHHEAHLYSAWIAGQPQRADFEKFRPCVSLIVSGGHTLLVLVEAELRHRVLGVTLDDAAGECFDKVAKLIGLPYPGGPEVDRLARGGAPDRFPFPRPLLDDAGDDFSFSGLKTSVRYFLRDNPAVLQNERDVMDLCASVQAAIVDVLVTKTLRAASRFGVSCVSASGGVACNSRFRAAISRGAAAAGMEARLAEPGLCTDNAAMIGVLAERKWMHGEAITGLDADIIPGWRLGQSTHA